MKRHDLERAAADYSHLRGLLMLPLAGLFIAAALANGEVLPGWTFVVAVAFAGVVCLAIIRHYRAHYGTVRPSPSRRRRDVVGMATAFVTVIGASIVLDMLPVNALAVAFALAMLAAYAVSPGLRTHHVAVWGALLLAGAVPVWNGTDSSTAGLLMAGAAVAVNGILDHRTFLHTFGPTAGVRA